MKNIVYLRGNEEIAKELAFLRNARREFEVLKSDNIIKSIEELSRLNLRYNINTGVVYIGNEWRSRPSNPKDIQVYDTIEDIIEWELMGWILNGASRLQRGFKVN